MDPRTNIDHIKQEYQAFCDGDFDAMGRMLADEVVWHVGGRRAGSGDKLGLEGTLDFLRRLAADTDQNFRIQVHRPGNLDQGVFVGAHAGSDSVAGMYISIIKEY